MHPVGVVSNLTQVENQLERLEDLSSSNSLRNFLCTGALLFFKMNPVDTRFIQYFLKEITA